MASFLILAAFFFSTAHAWVATSYWEVTVETTVNSFWGWTQTETVTIQVDPTAAVSAISTDTNNQGGDDVTQIDLYLSGSNLPVTTPYGYYHACPSSDVSCMVDTTTSAGATGIPTSTSYWVDMTVTQPATCTQTKFSYTSYITVNPPTEVITGLSITSSASHLTTSNNTHYSPATMYTYTELDLFLAPGQAGTSLDETASIMLGFCQDPRGCYSGQGEGCTATGDGIGAMTESHGPVKTSNGLPTATGTGTGSSKNSVGRNDAFGGGVLALGAVLVAFVGGIGLL